MMDREFAARFTQLKKGVFDLAEQELHRKVQECSKLEQAYLETVNRRREAQEARNHCSSAAELQQWQGYVDSLLWQEAVRRRQWNDATAEVEKQQLSVRMAHQDVRRWETVEGKVQSEFRRLVEHQQVKEADERAALQFGRADGS